MDKPKFINVKPDTKTLNEIIAEFETEEKKPVDENQLALNQNLVMDIDELRTWLDDLRICLNKNETDNISYLMTEVSCQADNLNKKYIAGPTGS